MYLFVKNKKIRINEIDHFLAEGGEGKLYKLGNVVYKIAAPLTQTKWNELSILSDHRLVKPEDVIFDQNGKEIGYTMKFIPGESLCRLFTTSFKNRNGITPTDISAFVSNFKSLIEYIHSKKILVIDLNERNFLLYNREIYGIDVNSYYTKSSKQIFLADSVRDWHTKKYSDITDWYSWAIVTFQMFIGIHPFRGKHPNFKGPLDETMQMRALNNISVFHKDVSIPDSCQSFDTIPIGLKDWYFSLFEQGKRTEPPANFDKIPTRTDVTITSQALNIVSEKVPDAILSIHDIGGMIIRGQNGTYQGKIKWPKCDYIVPFDSKPLLVNGNDIYYDGLTAKIDLVHEDKFVWNNKLVLVTDDSLLEVVFVKAGKLLISYRKLCGRFSSLKLCDGCAIQTLFEDIWLLPHSIKLPFKGSLLDAKLIDKYLMILLEKDNVHTTYLFNIETKEYETINTDQINFSLLNNMLIVITNDGILLKKDNRSKLITNHGLRNLELTVCTGRLFGYNHQSLYQLSLK